MKINGKFFKNTNSIGMGSIDYFIYIILYFNNNNIYINKLYV